MITAIDSKTALVLIDLQKGIVGLNTVHPAKDIVENAARLVAAFRTRKLPVVIVNVNPFNAHLTRLRVFVSSLPKEEEALKAAQITMKQIGFFDIVPEIETRPEDILITKSDWSAFYNTSLDEELKQRNITGIVLAGIATSIGVEGTARSASERGYNITFAEDAMSDLRLSAHENSLQTIFPRIGEVGSTATIINFLTNSK